MRPLAPRSFASSVAAIAFVIAARDALAQEAARNLPTGGRSILMGNTGVALGKDGTAPFLNPATVLAIDDSKLAFSVNVYRVALNEFANLYQPNPSPSGPFSGMKLSSTSYLDPHFDGLPSTLCFFFTLGRGGPIAEDTERSGRQKLAVCIGQVVTDDFSLTASSVGGSSPTLTSVEALSASENLHKVSVGPTYAVHVTDRLALGASLHGTVTTRSTQIRGTTLSVDGGGKSLSTTLLDDATGTSFELTSLLGATYRLWPATFGLAVSLPAIHVYGDAKVASFSQVTGSGASDVTTSVNASGSFSATPPVRVDAGAGFALGRTTFEVDLGVSLPTDAAYETVLKGTQTSVTAGAATSGVFSADYVSPARTALGGALGMERRIGDSFGILAGGGAEISTVPSGALTPTAFHDYPSRMNRVTASFGVASYGAAGELLIGTELSYGWGQRYAADVYSLAPTFGLTDTRSYRAMLVVAGAANFKSITQAITGVGDAVKKAVEEQVKRDREKKGDAAPSGQTDAAPPPAPSPPQ